VVAEVLGSAVVW